MPRNQQCRQCGIWRRDYASRWLVRLVLCGACYMQLRRHAKLAPCPTCGQMARKEA